MAGTAMARARGDALGGVLGALTLMGVLLSACANEPSPSPAEEGPPTAPVAIPPARAVPPGLDAALTLPAEVVAVVFDYTLVSYETPSGEEGELGMLVANTIERRTRGLMHRTGLPPATGMLFAFPVETRAPFWNQDTPMDIEIGFLDAAGVVVALLSLTANDPTLRMPEAPYLYAVEMPAGWWSANGAGLGTRFAIPAGVLGLAE